MQKTCTNSAWFGPAPLMQVKKSPCGHKKLEDLWSATSKMYAAWAACMPLMSSCRALRPCQLQSVCSNHMPGKPATASPAVEFLRCHGTPSTRLEASPATLIPHGKGESTACCKTLSDANKRLRRLRLHSRHKAVTLHVGSQVPKGSGRYRTASYGNVGSILRNTKGKRVYVCLHVRTLMNCGSILV